MVTNANNANNRNAYLYNCTVTSQGPTDNTTAPTISIASFSGNTITFNHSDLGGTFVPQYTRYVFNNGTHNWYNNTDFGNTVPSVNANTLTPTYTWSLQANGGGVATINSSTGVLILSGAPTSNITVRLTVSNISPISDKTVDFTLTRAAIAQNVTTVTEITNPTLSPTSAALYLNDSQEFTSSASAASVTTTVPAHTTLTGGGNTYYYYDGTLYASTDGFSTSTEGTPVEVTLAWVLSGDAAPYLDSSRETNSTTVTHATQSPSDLTATLTVTATATGVSPKTATATITAYGPTVAPTITRTDNTISISTTTAGATIYYTTDGTTPSATNGSVYTAPFDLVTSPTTVKAIAIRGGHASTEASETFQIQLAAPGITISDSGLATIAPDQYGATIHYTINGTTPTASSSTYTSPVQLTNPQTIKAIAVKTGYTTSEVATADYITSGVSGTKVVLDDREDHNWSYYSDYTDKPDNDYPNILLSPDPRNVKIIYDGNGGEVSYNESQNQFIYYKTIEKIDNAYTYKVIPNPFSKRPTVGTGNDRWRGFGGWKIISGAEFISGHNNNDVLTLEETLTLTGLDAGYTKNCLSATIELQATWVQAYVSTVNAQGNIESRPTALTGSTYETNFIVILDNRNHTVSGTGLVTISNRYPDGSAGGTGTVNGCTTSPGGTKVEFTNIAGIFTERDGQLIVGRGCTGTVSEVNGNNANRVKNIRLESGTYSFVHPLQGMGDNANNRGTYVFGCDYDRANVTNAHPYGDNTKLRIVVFTAINGSGGHANNSTDDLQNITIKSGYYGFTSDYAFWQNDKTDGWGLGVGGNTDNVNDEYVVPDENGVMRTYTWGTKPPQNTMSFYVGPTRGGGKGGRNVLRVEGGELSSINGGGTTTPDEFIRFDFRMTGGWVKGAIYGGASAVDCNGSSKIVITGGEVNSWVGGGCNGTDLEAGAGATNGTIYIYAGGNAQLRSHNSDGFYNNAWGLVNHIEGGQIYGGGRGMGAPGSYSGSATKAYVVVADESFVEQNVYGGSCHGVSQDGYVYILGGTVGKNVFGGSFEPTSTNTTWQAKNTHVRMYGGLVKGGIYGGNDASGTVTQDAEILILDGQVGIDASHTANIHGGGYGQATRVNGNVDVTLGTCDATTGVTVFGDVYGGSALGNVNTNANNTTTVSLYKGTIYGGLYGGGLGSESVSASVNGNVYVKVYGGSVLCSAADPVGEAGTGSVFGCNNVNGAPQNRVAVDIYSTDQPTSGYALHAVYGGGNKAAYTGVPVVTIHGCNNSIEYVYGGGNATDVRGTDVTIWGGTIGNAFGGGNGFSETGNHTNPGTPHYNPGANITNEGTKLKIYGGEIGAAFGGSNQFGTINSTIEVTVDTKTEPGNDPCSGVAYEECDLVIDELYGGGNEAPIQTNTGDWIVPRVVVLACDAYIKNFFGGAKAANYVGDIETDIVAGRFDNVFGGNNKGGEIKGNVTLNLRGGTIGNAFGGCNEKGDILGYITVNVIDGETECPLYITNVYGGGQDASYKPTLPTEPYIISPKVNINHTRRGTSVAGSVYGGGKGADAVVTANPYVTVGDDVDNHYSIVSGEVYGGGNAAAVSGNTEVLIKNRAKVIGNIYGGGNMGEVNGDTKVIINGRID